MKSTLHHLNSFHYFNLLTTTCHFFKTLTQKKADFFQRFWWYVTTLWPTEKSEKGLQLRLLNGSKGISIGKNHAHWKIASLVGGWATQLKNIISWNWIISPYLGVKMKNIWNHLFVVNDSNLSLPLEIQNLAPTKSQEFVARDVFLECKRRC